MQKNLFGGSFMDMLDSKDPLIVLANNFPWSKIETELNQYYTGIGRPPKPIRLMVGLLLLKQLEDLSDENVICQPYIIQIIKYSKQLFHNVTLFVLQTQQVINYH